jgi:alpha-glucoside transport system substrate-binding protein
MKGELKFSSPQVKKAVQIMSDLWFKPGYAYGERKALNTTYQWQVGPLMLATPPKCWLAKEPNWSLDYDGRNDYTVFDNKVYGQDYAFFLLPSIDPAYGTPVLVEGYITAMFHDRPEVRALMEYLTTGAQIEAWIKLGKHAGFSPHKEARLDWYTIPRERAVAEIAEAARKAGNLHFAAGDLRWPTVDSQYFTSISSYVNGDIDLDTALKQIDAAWPAPER